jgi:hypothetical protein
MQKFDHNIVFLEKRQFFRRKLSKVVENCDHNIDPWLETDRRSNKMAAKSDHRPRCNLTVQKIIDVCILSTATVRNRFADVNTNYVILKMPTTHSLTTKGYWKLSHKKSWFCVRTFHTGEPAIQWFYHRSYICIF